MKITPAFKPRFLTEDQLQEAINLFHLGRGQSRSQNRDHDGLTYAEKWMAHKYPALSATAIYKDLSNWRYSRCT